MPIEEIIKAPEQIAEDYAILSHVIADPQSWIDNAIANNLEHAIQEKINKYRQSHFDAKYLSISVDAKTGKETRVENPDYKTRAERDLIEKEKQDLARIKANEERQAKLSGKPDVEKLSTTEELKSAVAWLYKYLNL